MSRHLFPLGLALVLASLCTLVSCVGPRQSRPAALPRIAPPLTPHRTAPSPGQVAGTRTYESDNLPWRGDETPEQGSPWLFGVSPSVLPNVGLSATAAREFGVWHGGGLALELEFTDQFLDDTDFSSTNNIPAGNWIQVKFGGRLALPRGRGRWLTLRSGGVWFRARGRPNIVEFAGDYRGGFFEFGYEARLGKHLIVGPSIATMVVASDADNKPQIVPMVTWRMLVVP